MTALLSADVLAGEAGPLAPLADGELGTWEMAPGEDRDVEADELFVVLAGAGSVEVEGGPTLPLEPGGVVRLRTGDRTRWTVTEHLRKLYVAGPHAEAGTAELVTRDVATLTLTGGSHPGLWVEGGWPTAASEALGTVGGARVSVWEITAGVAADLEHDEYLLVLAGAGSLRIEGGPSFDLRPHVLVRLAEGSRTEWTVTDTLRALVVSAPA